MHKNNIKKVQVETVKIISETEKIIESLIEIEKKIKTEDRDEVKTLSYTHLTKHQKMLKNEKQKLDNLEYVVAVVGTMKAGKSMTINAIVGQEVLPSRTEAMTTLPTLITHVPHKTEPELTIKKVEPFNVLTEEIKVKLQDNLSITFTSGEKEELIKKIKNNKLQFQQKYEGQENILKFLKEINDLMRLAKELAINPPYAEYTDVDDLPRIEVEFYHLKKHNKNASEAKLTLLDTPGPNEVKQSELLKRIFNEQLQRASAVTLVVDYANMSTESDANVKEQVKDVANMLGKKHLFVLLNKFDERDQDKNETESYKEAKRLIYDDILKDKIDKNNVYPISSKSAFYANRGLCELDRNGKIDSSLPWRKSFGVEVLGETMWEMFIDNSDMVNMACQKKWEKSFFEEPLNNIISIIHSDALFLSLKSPLDKLENLLRKYGNAFKTRKNAYQKELSELKNIIKSLKEDINKVTEISGNIKDSINREIVIIESKIEKESKDIIKKIEAEVEKKLETSIESKKKEEKDRKNKGHKVDDSSFLYQKLWDGGLLDFRNKKDEPKNTDLDKLMKAGKLEYRDKDKAQKLIDGINNLFIQILGNSSNVMEQNINENIIELSNSIDNDIRNKLGNLLTKIEQKLSEEGDNLKIDLPKLSINFGIDSQGTLSASIKKGTETYTSKGDGFWNGVKNWFNSDWGTEEKTRDIFVIEKDEIIKNIRKALNKMQNSEMSKLTNRFDNTIKKPIENKLQFLTREIEGYRAEQLEVLKEREENEQESLEEGLQFTEKYQKKISKLDSRVKISINILGTNNE